MDNFHRLVLIPLCCFCSIPVLLATVAVQEASLWFGLSSIAALFVILWIIPLCKGRESLFAFLIVALMGLPINMKAIVFLWDYELVGDPFLVSGVLWSVALLGMLFSIEQIVIGILVRCLWPRQFKTRAIKICTEKI